MFRFQQWENGSTNPVRTFIVTADLTLTALYAEVTALRTVTLQSTPIAVSFDVDGQPVPSGTPLQVAEGATITVTAPSEVNA